jgi:hypothetical protein
MAIALAKVLLFQEALLWGGIANSLFSRAKSFSGSYIGTTV